MPRGGARVGAGRKKKTAPRDVELTPADPTPPSPEGELPLEYMLRVVRDHTADPSRRDRLAVAAAPYCHAKVGESGKKDAAKEAAKQAAGGRLRAQKVPPKLAIVKAG